MNCLWWSSGIYVTSHLLPSAPPTLLELLFFYINLVAYLLSKNIGIFFKSINLYEYFLEHATLGLPASHERSRKCETWHHFRELQLNAQSRYLQ